MMPKLLVMIMIFLTLMCLGSAVDSVLAEEQGLPRAFEHARLGMTFHDLTQTAPALKVATSRGEFRHVVQHPENRFVKRVDYHFVEDRLEQMTILYNANRLPAKGDKLLARLKELYGSPTSESTDYRPEAGFLSEKKTVWQDGRTRVTFIQRIRFDDDEVLEVELGLVDLELEAMKHARLREEERRQVADIPIPLPDRAPVRTAKEVPTSKARPERTS